MSKTSLWRIPVDHFKTLRSPEADSLRLQDYLSQVAFPIAAGVAASCLGAKLKDVSGAVAGVSIVAGLLFSMAVFLFQLRLSLKDDKRLGDDDYALVDECMKNTLWAILWGLALAVYLVICGAGEWMTRDVCGPILTGIAVGAALHFLLVIAMCLKRLRRAYERIAAKQQ